MTVTARPRKNRGYIEYTITGTFPDGEPYGFYPNGAPKRHKSPLPTVSATLRWAENKEKELQREWEERRADGFKPPTLQAAYDDYMEHSRVRKRNAEGTLEWKAIMWGHVSAHIDPNTRIDRISDKMIDALIAGVGGKEKSVNNVLDVFMGILRLAQRKKKLVHLPMVEKLKVPEAAPKYLHFEEYEAYLTAARLLEVAGHWEPLAIGLLGGAAGLRRGEMLALHQKNVDYERRRLTVEHSFYRGKIVTTKGKRFRVVGMSEELCAVLRRHRHLRGPMVFYTARGKPATPRAINLWFELGCKHAKLSPRGKLHVLRHTFGSHAALAGEDMHRIQVLLGHSDQRTTQIYARLAATAAIESVDRIEAYRAKVRQSKPA